MDGERRLAFFEAFLADYARILAASAAPARRDGSVLLETEEATYVAGDIAVEAPRVLRVTDLGEDAPLTTGTTRFDTRRRHVDGVADGLSERFANEMRRHGIRFYSRPRDGIYAAWEANPPDFGSAPG